MRAQKPRTLTLSSCKTYMEFRGYYEDKEAIKTIPGRRWNPREKAWEIPLNEENLQLVVAMFPGIKVHPAIRQILVEKQGLLDEAAKWKLNPEDAKPLEPIPLKTKPYTFQVAAINMGITIPSMGLLFEQGCGKTITSIGIMGIRYKRGEISKVLVVCPASVMPVWPKELEQHADFDVNCVPLEGSSSKRIQTIKQLKGSALQVAVINYEGAWRIGDELMKWAPDMLVCDESQRAKNPSAKQSRFLHRIAAKTPYKLILTGTPVTQGPIDVFSQWKILDPTIFGNSFYAFKARYVIFGGFENKQIVGYKNLPELIRKAHGIAFRVTKEEALDLPAQVDQELYCELEPKAARMYESLVRESIAELEGETLTAANILARLLRLSQLTGGFLTFEGEPKQVSEAKLNLLEETLEDLLGAGKKVVVFAQFVPEIKAIRKMLEKKSVGYAWIAGEVPADERGEEVRRFQEDPECKVFVAQIRTAGLGITLHAADTAIFYSLNYSYADYEQARSRIHRIGQQNKCTYIHLVAKGTVDNRILRILKNKGDVAAYVVDGWREIIMG